MTFLNVHFLIHLRITTRTVRFPPTENILGRKKYVTVILCFDRFKTKYGHFSLFWNQIYDRNLTKTLYFFSVSIGSRWGERKDRTVLAPEVLLVDADRTVFLQEQNSVSAMGKGVWSGFTNMCHDTRSDKERLMSVTVILPCHNIILECHLHCSVQVWKRMGWFSGRR